VDMPYAVGLPILPVMTSWWVGCQHVSTTVQHALSMPALLLLLLLLLFVVQVWSPS